MKKIILYPLFCLLILACSKSDNGEQLPEVIEEEIEQLFSCVSYDDLLDPQTTNQDDLMQYWTKFAADVK